MSDTRNTGTTAIRWRVLVADDDPDARRLLTSLLVAAGFSVTEAHDGRELYDMLTSAPPGYFRAVVADQRMPYLHGVDVLARAGSRAPFIIVSGDRYSDTETAAARFGAQAFFVKPFDIPKLIETVQWLVYGERTPPRHGGGTG